LISELTFRYPAFSAFLAIFLASCVYIPNVHEKFKEKHLVIFAVFVALIISMTIEHFLFEWGRPIRGAVISWLMYSSIACGVYIVSKRIGIKKEILMPILIIALSSHAIIYSNSIYSRISHKEHCKSLLPDNLTDGIDRYRLCLLYE